MSYAHACRRAVYEFAQCIALDNTELLEQDRADARFLMGSPKLTALADLTAVRNIPPCRPPPQLDRADLSFDAYWNIFEDQCRRRAIFYRTQQVADHVVIAQVYMPGLERFHLVRSGSLVAPLEVFG
jgi:ribosomal protein S12 methylthiotransferase accessory factor